MTRDDDRRKGKLKALIERLRRGENVQNRDLRTWLGEVGYADYEAECRQQCELRNEVKAKPSAVREYERRLKVALLAYNKGEGASSRGRHSAAERHFAQAETLFEGLLEYLQEITDADSSLRVWFDRDTSWTADGEANIDPVSIPRVVTSRSLDNRGGGLMRQLRTKHDLKIDAVERALASVDGDTGQEAVELSEKQQRLLQSFLQLGDDS
jgi:hypothetical protein